MQRVAGAGGAFIPGFQSMASDSTLTYSIAVSQSHGVSEWYVFVSTVLVKYLRTVGRGRSQIKC